MVTRWLTCAASSWKCFIQLPICPGGMAHERGSRRPTRTRSPRWRRAPRRSPTAARRSWCGCSSIRRSTPPAPAPRPEELIEARFPVHTHRPRRPVHLSRPRPAHRLCDARPQAAQPRRTPLRGDAGGMDHPHPGVLRRRAASGARSASASGCGGPTGRRPRGQDRRHRHPRAALGDAARHRHQCRAGACAFLRHRAVRRLRRALWRHQPRRSRRRTRPWRRWTRRCGGSSRHCSGGRTNAA